MQKLVRRDTSAAPQRIPYKSPDIAKRRAHPIPAITQQTSSSQSMTQSQVNAPAASPSSSNYKYIADEPVIADEYYSMTKMYDLTAQFVSGIIFDSPMQIQYAESEKEFLRVIDPMISSVLKTMNIALVRKLTPQEMDQFSATCKYYTYISNIHGDNSRKMVGYDLDPSQPVSLTPYK